MLAYPKVPENPKDKSVSQTEEKNQPRQTKQTLGIRHLNDLVFDSSQGMLCGLQHFNQLVKAKFHYFSHYAHIK